MSSENQTQASECCKEDFAKWNAAVNLHTAGEYQEALELYHSMHDITSRIYYNMAAAYINVGDIGAAIKCLTAAVRKDRGLAIAFFQRGTLYLECKNFKDAIADFETTRMLFRGNTFINYRPLGLIFYLHDFAILYNLALAHLLEGDDEKFRMLMTEATHNADHFQREQIWGTMILFKNKRWSEIQPINVTTGAVFVPPKQVTKNLERQKSSRSSKVIFASDENDNTPTFKGVKRLEELRRSLSPCRNLTDRQTSMKRKLFRKMKSTGDIKVPAAAHMYDSATRKGCSSESSESTPAKSNTLSSFPVTSAEQMQLCSTDCHKELYRKVDSEVLDIQNNKTNIANLVEENVSDERKSSCHGKSLFTCKAKSLGDIKNRANEYKSNKWKSSKSAGDLGKPSKRPILPLEKKQKSKTSSSSLKRMLNPKQKADSNSIAPDGSHPTVIMHGCQAASASLAIAVPFNSSQNNGFETDNVKDTDKLDVNNNDNKVNTLSSKSKFSLGSVFGDRSTVVKFALTEACDVLTAAVTPTIDESEVNRRNKSKLKHNCLGVPGLVRNEQTIVKSKKKKRAPDPPKSVIKPHLFAATQLITAIVHQDVGQTAGGLNEGTANSGSPVYAGSSCVHHKRVQSNSISYRQSECQSFSDKKCQKPNEAHVQNTTTKVEKNTIKLIESTMNMKSYSEHSDVLESEIIFEDTKVEITCQNLALPTETSNKTSLTPRDTQSRTEQKTPNYENIAYLKKNKPEQNKKEWLDSVLKTGNISQNTNDNSGMELINDPRERYNEFDVYKSSKHSSRKTKVPPPSYPPPPLRPFYWKVQKKKHSKGKQPKTELGGMIGNAIVSSGQILGAVVDSAINNAVRDSNLHYETNKHKKTVFDRRRDLEAEIPKEGDHDYVNVACTSRKCDESGTIKTERDTYETNAGDENEACEICGDILNTETIHSSKMDKSDLNDSVFAPFKHLTLADHVLALNACSCSPKQKTKQEPETKHETPMTSYNLMMAFVTSNQERRQAFKAFVEEKCGRNDQENIACNDVDVHHVTDHDYVNVSRL